MGRIATSGADLKLVNNSICFEISTDPEKASAQLAANKELVNDSNGHLAPVSGKEKYLTIDRSHTTAGCKAAMFKAKGVSQVSAWCINGKLDPDKLSMGSSDFKKMLEHR